MILAIERRISIQYSTVYWWLQTLHRYYHQYVYTLQAPLISPVPTPWRPITSSWRESTPLISQGTSQEGQRNSSRNYAGNWLIRLYKDNHIFSFYILKWSTKILFSLNELIYSFMTRQTLNPIQSPSLIQGQPGRAPWLPEGRNQGHTEAQVRENFNSVGLQKKPQSNISWNDIVILRGSLRTENPLLYLIASQTDTHTRNSSPYGYEFPVE